MKTPSVAAHKKKFVAAGILTVLLGSGAAFGLSGSSDEGPSTPPVSVVVDSGAAVVDPGAIVIVDGELPPQ
jgi:hypothetical protein